MTGSHADRLPSVREVAVDLLVIGAGVAGAAAALAARTELPSRHRRSVLVVDQLPPGSTARRARWAAPALVGLARRHPAFVAASGTDRSGRPATLAAGHGVGGSGLGGSGRHREGPIPWDEVQEHWEAVRRDAAQRDAAVWSAVGLGIPAEGATADAIVAALAADGGLVPGSAWFLGPDQVLVEPLGAPARLPVPLAVRAARVILAIGSVPVLPDIAGLDETAFLTVDTLDALLDEPAPPPAAVVLGAGRTGCALAQALARVGSTVTLVEVAGRVLPRCAPEISGIIAAALRRDGVRLITGARIVTVAPTLDGGAWVGTGGGEDVAADRLIVATGHRAAVDGLNLPMAGIELAASGRAPVVDARLRTSNHRVFAAGAVVGTAGAADAAAAMGRLAARHALAHRIAGPRVPHLPSWPEVPVPWTTATDPQVALVGRQPAPSNAVGARTVADPGARPEPGLDRDPAAGGDLQAGRDARAERARGAELGPESGSEHGAEGGSGRGADRASDWAHDPEAVVAEVGLAGRGFVRLVAEAIGGQHGGRLFGTHQAGPGPRAGRLIGAAVVAGEAAELIAPVTVAVQASLPPAVLASGVLPQHRLAGATPGACSATAACGPGGWPALAEAARRLSVAGLPVSAAPSAAGPAAGNPAAGGPAAESPAAGVPSAGGPAGVPSARSPDPGPGAGPPVAGQSRPRGLPADR